MSKSVKVLVVGSVDGQIKKCISRLTTINEKNGPFDFVICCGDFLGESEEWRGLVDGTLTVPTTTYFTRDKYELPDECKAIIKRQDGELCPDLYYFDRQGACTTASKVSIVFCHYDDEKRDALRIPDSLGKIDQVDILITNQWPRGITNKSSKTYRDQGLPIKGSDGVSATVKSLAPKYHFASDAGIFFEREPYTSSPKQGADPRLTRFIGLGKAFNATKDRWFYAFNLPLGAKSLELPAGTTASPFEPDVQLKRSIEDGRLWLQDSNNGAQQPAKRKRVPDGYRCNICQGSGHHISDCPEKGIRRNEIGPDQCWFCLSNQHVAKHLIVSIASESYLCLPKGQLVKPWIPELSESTSPDSRYPIPGGGHVLIVPIAHLPTLHQIPSDLSETLLPEIERYKAALRAMYEQHGAVPVAFEIARGVHAHIQVIPIPISLQDQIEEMFMVEGKENGGFDFLTGLVPDDRKSNYIEVELPNGKCLYHLIDPVEGKRSAHSFDPQIARAAIARIFETPERIDWKACVEGDSAAEGREATTFKQAWKNYDFTL